MQGDKLASGQKSAQFSVAAGLNTFEDDLAIRTEIVGQKYGLSEAEITSYLEKREKGEKLPDLKPIEDLKDGTLGSGIEVVDRRNNYLDPKPVPKKEKKFQDKEYGYPYTILDRVLVKRVPEDEENYEILSDGSLRDKRTGFVIPYAYRQHNNIGIVLAVGQFVIMGGVRVPMSDIVKLGDRVCFGDYNSEVYKQSEDKTKAMCDAVQMNYEADEEGLRVIRVQDIRTIERPIGQMSWFKTLLVTLKTLFLTGLIR